MAPIDINNQEISSITLNGNTDIDTVTVNGQTVFKSELGFDAFGDGSAVSQHLLDNNANDVGGSHPGNLVGGSYRTDEVKFGTHSVYVADSNFHYFDIPSLPNIDGLSFWFNHAETGVDGVGYLVDFRHDDPGNGRPYIYNQDGSIDLDTDDTASDGVGDIYINGQDLGSFSGNNFPLTPGEWIHVACSTAGNTQSPWDRGLRFGNRSDGDSGGESGYFDNIRTFNRPITQSEAQTLFQEGQ